MKTDKQSTKTLAREFFEQLRSDGYTQNQVIGLAGELLDLVREDLAAHRAEAAQAAARESRRPTV
ncbi:MAG TPA: hypothetical protein VK013_04915 [Myxococcaceae bacterium]|nr:hypothetical protein [Myxococcaceae bacterium]